MCVLLADFYHFSVLACDLNMLSWDNLLEGHVSHHLALLCAEFPRSIRSRLQIESWARQLMKHLINITHHQWLYRNECVHLKLVEGNMAAEHLDIMAKCKGYDDR